MPFFSKIQYAAILNSMNVNFEKFDTHCHFRNVSVSNWRAASISFPEKCIASNYIQMWKNAFYAYIENFMPIGSDKQFENYNG